MFASQLCYGLYLHAGCSIRAACPPNSSRGRVLAQQLHSNMIGRGGEMGRVCMSVCSQGALNAQGHINPRIPNPHCSLGWRHPTATGGSAFLVTAVCAWRMGAKKG